VHIPHGRPQHAQPFEITHHARWLDSLLDKSRIAPRNCVARPFARGLRTLVAVNPEQRRAAEELVRRRYAWRGYQAANDCANAEAAGERVTLLAEKEGRLLGTVTVRPDAPLLAEKTYGGEIERLRQGGRRVGELVKFAVEEGADWKAAMDAALAGGATISHHHGVGQVRSAWIRSEMGGWWAVWESIRKALDPGGVLNPNALGGARHQGS